MRTLMVMVAMMVAAATAAEETDIQLDGMVTGKDGLAVGNARVALKNHPSLVVYTDANGGFTLSGSAEESGQEDSLVVIARGYRTALVGITSYEQGDLDIVLNASHQWIPSGPLDYRGSMVKIEAAGHDFEMGQPCDTVRGLVWDMPTSDVEQPVHTVEFTYDFWMDTVEVQQKEYDSLMRLTYGSSYSRPTWNVSNGMGDKWAAYSIEWGSAALFCNARSKYEGLPDTAYSYSGIAGRVGVLCTLQNVAVDLHANAYRLPTEAEWEYACRAGSTSDYYWGKSIDDYGDDASVAEIDSYAIWSNNSFSLGKGTVIRSGFGGDSSYYGTHETGKRKPNAYGLYDMAGNLSEWCNDWYDYYSWGVAVDPAGPSPENPTALTRVLRGGNWSNDLSYLRSTERQFDGADYQFLFCGFRTASSGLTNRVRKTGAPVWSRIPSVYLSAGILHCDNAAGCNVGIFTMQGRNVFSTTTENNRFQASINKVGRGTYFVRVTGKQNLTGVIHVVE
jgi:formylglycine-generating enzyme required for sulfatase activity